MNNLWYRLPFYLTLVSGKEWTGYPLECLNARVGALKNYQIYGNSVQSELPQGYTLLEYISNGVNREPFINTNIMSNGNDVYEIDFSLNLASDTRCVFGGRIGPTSNGRALWLTPNIFYPQYENYEYRYRPIQNISPEVDIRYQYKSSGPLSEINIYGDSQKYYSDYESAETYDGGQIIIFGVANVATRDTRTAYMKVYSFRITRDDTVIMNLVPCINPNNEIGMYDTVSKTFFGNAGTGEFIAGPIAQPETPVMSITPQYPSPIESVGEYTPEGYQIPVNVNGEITNIYLSEPLRKIGDVADYIDYENQKVVRWFKEETIKSSGWEVTGTGPWLNRTYFDTTAGYVTSVICSHFKSALSGAVVGSLQDLTLARHAYDTYPQRLYIRYDAPGFTTGEQITQWLKENKPTIVYQLATPIEESIELPEIRLPGACVITTDTKIKPSKMYGKQ